MLRYLGPWAVVALALAVILLAPGKPLASPLHVALAMGVLPLIAAAMCHFVPVLTRTRPAPRVATGLSLFTFVAGSVGAHGVAHNPAFLAPGLLLGVIAVAALGVWIQGRAMQGLGDPHPGLRWYLGALACLFGGLLAMLGALTWPELWLPLRRVHLHLNLLGFVGLTALGTLQVLLPTAAGYTDPGIALRLRSGFPWALGGTLAIALGAATWAPLAWLGALAWLVAVAPFARAALDRRSHWQTWHGSGIALASALGGFLLLLGAGALHGAGWMPARLALELLIPLFLLPLVTGALTHLLPLWRRPAQPEGQALLRERLARGAGLRLLAFAASGLLFAAGMPGAAWPALLGVVQFLVQALRGVPRS